MDYICTWMCADTAESESYFPQVGANSVCQDFQAVYWRCVVVFFAASRYFNYTQKHVLFTNVHQSPVVDGVDIFKYLHNLDVEIKTVDFKYKTPKGYFQSWQNQFFEFSIIDYIATSEYPDEDFILILDSDCIFRQSAASLFDVTRSCGYATYLEPYPEDYLINGVSRMDMKRIYEEFLGTTLSSVPEYHFGEFLLANVANIRKLSSEFKILWPALLERHRMGLKKFNEEAHTLSYLYFKNGYVGGGANKYIRRIWTDQRVYRHVQSSDINLTIWHLPAEKKVGFVRLYSKFSHLNMDSLLKIPDHRMKKICSNAV